MDYGYTLNLKHIYKINQMFKKSNILEKITETE